MCNKLGSVMQQDDAPTQKYGYLDIKQSSKVKARKWKSWRRRWVVLTKMSDFAADKIVARLDVYDNEAKWKSGAADRTFFLESVTRIEKTKSRTHPHAFEIVEGQPTLVMSGSDELESYGWILALRQIFTPEAVEEKKDTYQVELMSNEHSTKWSLSGEYTLTVSTACISVLDKETNTGVSWGLSTLIKFKLTKHPVTQEETVLEIQCGVNSPTGQSTFLFHSTEAAEIMSTIRHSICMALAKKQSHRRTQSRQRTISATISEKSFQSLLDSNPVHPEWGRDRSGSDSSTSTVTVPGSPSVYGLTDSPTANGGPGLLVGGVKAGSVSSPNGCPPHRPPRLCDVGRSNSGRSTSELSTSLDAIEETPDVSESGDCPDTPIEDDVPDGSDNKISPKWLSDTSALSKNKNDPGYSVIKDSKKGEVLLPPRRRRNTVGTSPFENSPSREESTIGVSNQNDVKRKFSTGKKSVSFEGSSTIQISTTEDTEPSTDDTGPLLDNSKTEKHHYQELDAFQEAGFGRLNRRRSSSTGDLSLVSKLRGREGTFENVYEELDEMRSTVSKFSSVHLSDSETPPALPARPYSMTFTSRSGHDNRQDNKKKRSFFKNSKFTRARSATTSVDTLAEAAGPPCSCDEIRASRLKTISRDGKCVACGGDNSFIQARRSRSEKRLERWSSSEEIINSAHSSVSDIYTTIPDVLHILARRRRSSDITPVSPTALDASQDVSKSLKFQTLSTKWTRSSQDISPSNGVSEGHSDSSLRLIDFSSDGLDPPTQPQPNPLESFFLDEESFESNPMVTGELKPTASKASSGLDLLSLYIESSRSASSTTQNTHPSVGNSTALSTISPFTTLGTTVANFNMAVPNGTANVQPVSTSQMTSTMTSQLQVFPSWNTGPFPPFPAAQFTPSPPPPPPTSPSLLSPFTTFPPHIFPQNIPPQQAATSVFTRPIVASASMQQHHSSPAFDTYMSMAPRTNNHSASWATFDDPSPLQDASISEDIYVSPTTPLSLHN